MKIPGELDAFRKEFNELVKPLAEKFGAHIKLGTQTYNGNEFTARLTVTDTGSLKDGQSPRDKKLEDDYKNHCQIFDLKPEWLGKSFITQGGEFTIVGLKTRASKNPVVVKSKNGSGYVFNADSIRLRMNAVEANEINSIK